MYKMKIKRRKQKQMTSIEDEVKSWSPSKHIHQEEDKIKKKEEKKEITT